MGIAISTFLTKSINQLDKRIIRLLGIIFSIFLQRILRRPKTTIGLRAKESTTREVRKLLFRAAE